MKILVIRALLWWTLGCAGICGSLAGCGQKGDLYLPESNAPVPTGQAYR